MATDLVFRKLENIFGELRVCVRERSRARIHLNEHGVYKIVQEFNLQISYSKTTQLFSA